MLIGHEKIVSDFKKLIKSGELSHGYIFFGPSMVGKCTTAMALARFLEKGEFEPPAKNEVLQEAKLIDANSTNSIGIDAVREIKNFLWQRPNASPRRVLIIDEAELLTSEAQNALLKVTEEPPASSLLIVITSDGESLIGTIRSRLQAIHFSLVTQEKIEKWLPATAAPMPQEIAKVPGKKVRTVKQKGAPASISVKDAASHAFGKPGLAWKLTHDKTFQENIDLAAKFLKTTPASRKDFIKKLIEPDEFNLRIFLDAVIMNLAWERSSKTKAALWHKAMALQQNVSNFGLNPRLQLESLLM